MMAEQQLHGQRLEDEEASRFVVLRENDQNDSIIRKDIKVQRRQKTYLWCAAQQGFAKAHPQTYAVAEQWWAVGPW